MVDQFLIGNMRNFIYLVSDGEDALVFDPQTDLTPWQKRLTETGAKLRGVVLTHSHWDHVAGVPEVMKQYPGIPVYLHESDAFRLNKYPAETRDRFKFVGEGDRIRFGSRELEVLHTPGHSVGECTYLLRGKPDAVFTGDTVFVGQVGRTDLETGSTAELFATLERLKRLAPETIVYPGHDYGKTPTSTIGRESLESEAFRCKTVEELDACP